MQGEPLVRVSNREARLGGTGRDDPFFPSRRARRLVFGALLVGLALFGALDVRRRLATGPGAIHRSDFSCYVVAARALADGNDPYAVANPRGWHYLYPPFLALLLVPVRDVPLTALGLAWFALNVAAAVGTYFQAIRIGRVAAAKWPAWLAYLPFLAVVPPAVSCFQRGQVSLVLLFLEVLGLRLVLEGRSFRMPFAGGVLLAMAAAIKLVPALPAAVLLGGLAAAAATGSREVRRLSGAFLGLAAGVVLFLWVVPAGVLGADRNAALLGRFVERVVTNPRLASDAGIQVWAPSNVSLLNAMRRAREVASGRGDAAKMNLPPGPEGPAEAAFLVVAGLLLTGMALALSVKGSRAGDPLVVASAFGLALSAGLLLSPLTWLQQLVQLVPALAFPARALLERGMGRAGLAVAAAPAAAVWAAYAIPPLAGAGFLGLFLALWTGATAAALLIARPRRHEA
jgi:hypothetical protein